MSTSTTLDRAEPSAAAFTCPPDHKHEATGTCYHQHQCRCVPCRSTAIAKTAEMRKLIAYGRWQPLVDAAPARRHLAVLAAAGIGHRRAAVLSGVSETHVRDIATGTTLRVRPSTMDRIRSIPATRELLAPGCFTDARGVRRRLQALHAVGWSPTALAPHLGMFPTNVSRIRDAQLVTVRVRDLVVEVYDRLWDATPTNTARSQEVQRRTAAAAGWVPPLAWDDIDVDEAPAAVDEHEIVDELAVDLAVAGARVKLTRAERLIALSRLHARGHLDGELADLLCVTDRTISRDRRDLGLPANYFAEEVAA